MTSVKTSSISDADWGCDHFDLSSPPTANIRACRVSITDITKLAAELTRTVVDTSWMSHLDKGARRAYEKTVAETADLLVEIFSAVDPASGVAADFGELMVSMGSARALKMVFSHSEVPLSELWKPQVKQNEGFDFHTICPGSFVNFGEAKYSSTGNPHGLALEQISDFLTAEKHYRDRTHLVNIVPASAINKLDDNEFGVIAAFSLNSKNQELVINNAVKAAEKLAAKHQISQIFLVGVSYEP